MLNPNRNKDAIFLPLNRVTKRNLWFTVRVLSLHPKIRKFHIQLSGLVGPKNGVQGEKSAQNEWFAWVWMLQLAGALQRAQALKRAGALQRAGAL